MKLKITVYMDEEIVDKLDYTGVPRSLFIESAVIDALDSLKDNSQEEEQPTTDEQPSEFVSQEHQMVSEVLKCLSYTPEMFRIQGNRFNKGQEDAIALEIRRRYSRVIGNELMYKLLPEEFTK